jgi:hypothetical protein
MHTITGVIGIKRLVIGLSEMVTSSV